LSTSVTADVRKMTWSHTFNASSTCKRVRDRGMR
jgi:hypothetical protein